MGVEVGEGECCWKIFWKKIIDEGGTLSMESNLRMSTILFILLYKEAATGTVLWRKVFLKNSQNSQENTCARVSFLMKLQLEASNFIKK